MSEQEKREKAMRIFEALSMADRELLVRAEKQERVVSFPRVTKVLAACVCVAVVGMTVCIRNGAYKSVEKAWDCTAQENQNEMSVADMAVRQDASETAGGEALLEDERGAAEAAEITEEAEAGLAAELTKKEAVEKEVTNDAHELLSDGIMEEACSADETVEYLSEEELRAVEVLGAYVPKQIPEGYLFESGFRVCGIQEDMLHICWVKGMDSIVISISRYEPVGEECLADISKPETYDVQLYEIPYAETVPEEYSQVFEHPVFRVTDFSEEVVAARMKSYEDSGDTTTPRGRFSVFYEEGIEVGFNGDCTVEEVWEMFESIG